MGNGSRPAQVSLTKKFQAQLQRLKTSGRRQQYTQATAIVVELQQGTEVSKRMRSESRIPNAVKFELPDGHRIVFQKVAGKQPTYLALAVGSHAHVDEFLDNHHGWVFDKRTGQIQELRLVTQEESVSKIRPTPEVLEAASAEDVTPAVFAGFTDDMLDRLGVPRAKWEAVRSVRDIDGFEYIELLDTIPERASEFLLSFSTGDDRTRAQVRDIATGDREYHPTIPEEIAPAIKKSTEEFVELRNLQAVSEAAEAMDWEDWMLFLHPDQKQLVDRRYNGPARVRGVSGSGKTVVLVHRAVRHAKAIKVRRPTGLDAPKVQVSKVLVLTYNRSLTDALRLMISRLIPYHVRQSIDVTTIDQWSRDLLRRKTKGEYPWSPDDEDALFFDSIRDFPTFVSKLSFVPTNYNISESDPGDIIVRFLQDELDFVYGKFLSEEMDGYLTCTRTGRPYRLSKDDRKLVLMIARFIEDRYRKKDVVPPAEVHRQALKLLQADAKLRKLYSAVLVDEVQDLTEIQLRLVKEIAAESMENLFLVGDGAQRIFNRGFSMANVGIDIRGRSTVFRRNYRNSSQIVEAASALLKSQSIGRYDDDPKISQLAATPSGYSADRPILARFPTEHKEVGFVVNEIVHLHDFMGVPYERICVASRTRTPRTLIERALTERGIETVEYRARGVSHREAVKLSSLHNLKGHEFPAVFIVGLYDGALPYYREHGDLESEYVEQEATLLYVAMTRAKDLLYLTYADEYHSRPKKPSRFLSAIEDFVARVDPAPAAS